MIMKATTMRWYIRFLGSGRKPKFIPQVPQWEDIYVRFLGSDRKTKFI